MTSCDILQKDMKLLAFFKGNRKKNTLTDIYQESIEKFGRDQIKKLVDKGLSIPIIVL